MNKLQNKLSNYPGVEKADILFDEDFFQLAIEIYLSNGGRLLLSHVDENLRGSIKIDRIGNYAIFSFGHVLNPYSLYFVFDIKANSVEDFIENYDKIYKAVEGLPNFSKLKEFEGETIDEIIERNPSLFKPVYVFKEEYCYATIDYDDESFRRFPRKTKENDNQEIPDSSLK
jgi:hypothetical protein